MSRKFLEPSEIATPAQRVGVSIVGIIMVILLPILSPLWLTLWLIGIFVPYKEKGEDGMYR